MTTRRLLYETGRKSIGHELNSSRLAIADSLQLLYGGLVVCSVLVGQRRRRGLLVVSSQQNRSFEEIKLCAIRRNRTSQSSCMH